MAEYIEREALYQKIHNAGGCDAEKSSWADGWDKGIDEAVRLVTEAPSADVVEVRHGEWIYHECVSSHDGAKSGFACSVCSGFVEEEIFDMDEFNKAFCGACGAKMDGKGENDG